MEKLRLDQEKSARRFADLKQDLADLQLRSPLSGIVYYGACDQGRWTTGAMVGKKLVAGGKLMPNEVFMTVVDPTKLMLRASIGEGDLARIRPGTKGEAVPTSAPESKLAAEVESVDIVPQPAGNYLATLSVKIGRGARLMPGMNCKITFKDVPRHAALLVPKAAVNTEGKESRVMVKSGGKEEARVVKVGESDAMMTEILDGLKVGDVVLVKKGD